MLRPIGISLAQRRGRQSRYQARNCGVQREIEREARPLPSVRALLIHCWRQLLRGFTLVMDLRGVLLLTPREHTNQES